MDNPETPNPFEELEEAPQLQEVKAGPKPFTIAIIVIAGIFVLSVVALIVVLLLKGPQQSSAVKEQADKINAQNTQVAQQATARALENIALQKTLEAGQKAPLPSATPLAPAVTATSVVAVATATPQPTSAQPTAAPEMLTRTAVVATQLAQGTVFPTQPGGVGGNATATSSASGAATATKAPGTGGVGAGTPQATSTALPSTGFVDEVGLPALFGLGLALIAVVILARRLRLSANR